MTNCDILIGEDYAAILEYHQMNNNIVTMVCTDKRMEIPYGTVDVNTDHLEHSARPFRATFPQC